MKNTEHFNIPYPEPTDLLLQFPNQLAKPNAELIDTLLYEQEQKQTALDAALDGKAPLSHTHSTSQVTGLDEALDGKAPLSHTHSTSQVTGLDEALDGKAPLTTLNTRVPENLALHVDTTVGTRIFAGDTMIYGDTGWRNVSADLINGWTGDVRLRRTTTNVYLEVRSSATTAASGGGSMYIIPAGFRPDFTSRRLLYTHPESKLIRVDVYGSGEVTLGGWTAGDQPRGGFSLATDRPWPTSLPGTPA